MKWNKLREAIDEFLEKVKLFEEESSEMSDSDLEENVGNQGVVINIGIADRENRSSTKISVEQKGGIIGSDKFTMVASMISTYRSLGKGFVAFIATLDEEHFSDPEFQNICAQFVEEADLTDEKLVKYSELEGPRPSDSDSSEKPFNPFE